MDEDKEDKDMHPHRRRLAGAGQRRDDRNEELDESPVPDPEAEDTGAEDDPEAD